MKYDKIVWVDLETGGVDSSKHQITQIGALATGPAPDFDVIGMFEAKVVLEPGSYEEQALEAQNYDPAVWDKDAMDSIDVCVFFSNWVTEFTHNRVSRKGRLFASAHLAGHNVVFDGEFIRSNWGYVPVTNWTGGYLDTIHVQKVMDVINGKQMTDDYKLETLCKFYNVEPGGHDALADVEATVKVAREQFALLGRLSS